MEAEGSPISEQTPSSEMSEERLKALAKRVGPSHGHQGPHPWIALLMVFIFVGGVAFASLQWVIHALIHTRKEVILPDLKGKTLEQTLDIVSPLNLSLKKEGVEVDESVPPGAVIKQIPPAGLKVREGKVIRVTLSSGGQVVFVPELVGKPMASAQNELRSAGLSPGALTQAYSHLHDKGRIIDQAPEAGNVLNYGGMVDLRVSKGKPPQGTMLMPDFVNRPLSQAKRWASENNIEISVKRQVLTDVLPGLVISQIPLPDTIIKEKGKLRFVVSKSNLMTKDAKIIRYDVPTGEGRSLIRIVVRDEKEEREIYKDYQNAGTLVEVPVVIREVARARIFVNGVLIEERIVE